MIGTQESSHVKCCHEEKTLMTVNNWFESIKDISKEIKDGLRGNYFLGDKKYHIFSLC